VRKRFHRRCSHQLVQEFDDAHEYAVHQDARIDIGPPCQGAPNTPDVTAAEPIHRGENGRLIVSGKGDKGLLRTSLRLEGQALKRGTVDRIAKKAKDGEGIGARGPTRNNCREFRRTSLDLVEPPSPSLLLPSGPMLVA
jgi:hypothetical protein